MLKSLTARTTGLSRGVPLKRITWMPHSPGCPGCRTLSKLFAVIKLEGSLKAICANEEHAHSTHHLDVLEVLRSCSRPASRRCRTLHVQLPRSRSWQLSSCACSLEGFVEIANDTPNVLTARIQSRMMACMARCCDIALIIRRPVSGSVS
eukprot:2075586-Amphidinium_carterae.1